MTNNDTQLADKAKGALHDVMLASDSDASRVTAAKALLQSVAPKKDDEEQKNEAAERDSALAEARGLLAEFAALKHAFFRLQNEVAEASAAPASDAAWELARLADLSRSGLGENTDGG